MSTEDLSRDDVTAMRQEGDLRAFMRQGIRQGRSAFQVGLDRFRRGEQHTAASDVGHTPGAWPGGTAGAGPGSRLCHCPDCAAYADGQPTNDTAESA